MAKGLKPGQYRCTRCGCRCEDSKNGRPFEANADMTPHTPERCSAYLARKNKRGEKSRQTRARKKLGHTERRGQLRLFDRGDK